VCVSIDVDPDSVTDVSVVGGNRTVSVKVRLRILLFEATSTLVVFNSFICNTI
jgi:hypothetical protein